MKLSKACLTYCPIKIAACISNGCKTKDDLRDMDYEFYLCEVDDCPKWIEEPCGYERDSTKCQHYKEQESLKDFEDYCYECDNRHGHCAG